MSDLAEPALAPKKSTHKVEVVRVVKEPCPNSDSLSIIKVFGYQVVECTDLWSDGDLGAYIVPDSVVDVTRPEFAFLADPKYPDYSKVRIKVKRIRGAISQGLLVPAPPGTIEGDDVAELLGVTRYEPPEPISSGGEAARGPEGWRPVYDVDSHNRYSSLFVPGELVVATEKIHGENGRWMFQNDRMFAGSKTEWKREDEKNKWWKALRQTPSIQEFCTNHPGATVYGEVYGMVKGFNYGVVKGSGEVRVAVFDIWTNGTWLDHDAARAAAPDLPWVPEVCRGVYDAPTLLALAEKDSIMPGAQHMAEGIVVKPILERIDPSIGRVQLKCVSNRYFMSKS